MNDVPVSLLRSVLSYDPDTGVLTWKWRPREFFKDDRSWKIWNTRYADKEAFTAVVEERPNAFYRRGRFAGKTYYAHRVAWALHTGEWPEGEVDHQNGDGLANWFDNLCDGTHADNGRNIKLPVNNTSGVIGVYFHKQTRRWQAKIKYGKRQIHIGLYDTIEDAAAARKIAERQFGFHENHGRIVT